MLMIMLHTTGHVHMHVAQAAAGLVGCLVLYGSYRHLKEGDNGSR